jgi:hypothetical protein
VAQPRTKGQPLVWLVTQPETFSPSCWPNPGLKGANPIYTRVFSSSFFFRASDPPLRHTTTPAMRPSNLTLFSTSRAGPRPRLHGARGGALVLVLRQPASLTLVLGSDSRHASLALDSIRPPSTSSSWWAHVAAPSSSSPVRAVAPSPSLSPASAFASPASSSSPPAPSPLASTSSLPVPSSLASASTSIVYH